MINKVALLSHHFWQSNTQALEFRFYFYFHGANTGAFGCQQILQISPRQLPPKEVFREWDNNLLETQKNISLRNENHERLLV